MKTLVLLFAALALSAVAGEKALEVPLTGGKPPAAQRTLRVSKGDHVLLRWTSDRPITLHLHGYDIETSVPANGGATMRFDAAIAGRFAVSEHANGAGHHRAVLYVEVLP